MKRTLFATAAILGCLILCRATVSDLSGKWSGSLLKADSTDYPLSYNFTLLGDSITGTAKSQLGEFLISRGKLDTAGFHFIVTVNGLDIYHAGKFYGDSVGMDITLNGSIAHCTLRRSSN